MINPVSHPIAIEHAATEFSNTSTQSNSSSSISSVGNEENPGLLRRLGNIGRKIASVVVSIFSYLASWVMPSGDDTDAASPSLSTDLSPKVEEKIDSIESNTYGELAFVKTPEGKLTFRNQKAYALTHNLFFNYMRHGATTWSLYILRIKAIEKKLMETPHHPLELLTFLFLNKELTSSVAAFHKAAHGNIDWLLKKFGEENPWKQFIDKQVKNFEHHSDSMPQMHRGFAKTLQLDEQLVTEYINDKNWADLITYTFESRRKYFSI